MDEIRFEPLPPKPTAASEHPLPLVAFHLRTAAALRERPGEWAFVRTAASHSAAKCGAYQIAAGNLHSYQPRGHFEAAARTVDGEHRIYVRFVGGGDPS